MYIFWVWVSDKKDEGLLCLHVTTNLCYLITECPRLIKGGKYYSIIIMAQSHRELLIAHYCFSGLID